MDYKELVKALRCDGNNIGQDSDGCTNKKCRYRDQDSACNIVSICEDAAAAITDLLVENQSLRNAANGFKARAEAAEARCKTLEKMVKEYQDVIVPGYRERAEKAERESDEAREVICTRCSVLPCRGNECYWYRGQKEE